MINTIIFDFGDIFINLNYEKSKEAFEKLGLNDWNDDLKSQNSLFEIGQISELQFLESFQPFRMVRSYSRTRPMCGTLSRVQRLAAQPEDL